MSTAFLVDNILNDKEEIRSESIVSDSDSDEDLKDSVCGSPESDENNSQHYYHHHIHQQSMPSGGGNGVGGEHTTNKINQFSETLLRTYNTMIQQSDCVTSDHSDDTSNHFVEMCCTKCGHFQYLNKSRNGNNGGLTNVNDCSDDNNTDIDIDFKCDKCDSSEGVISSQKETTTTILKDNAKPILKFSVSAILGDKKECARVRNGKWMWHKRAEHTNHTDKSKHTLPLVIAIEVFNDLPLLKCLSVIEHFFQIKRNATVSNCPQLSSTFYLVASPHLQMKLFCFLNRRWNFATETKPMDIRYFKQIYHLNSNNLWTSFWSWNSANKFISSYYFVMIKCLVTFAWFYAKKNNWKSLLLYFRYDVLKYV